MLVNFLYWEIGNRGRLLRRKMSLEKRWVAALVLGTLHVVLVHKDDLLASGVVRAEGDFFCWLVLGSRRGAPFWLTVLDLGLDVICHPHWCLPKVALRVTRLNGFQLWRSWFASNQFILWRLKVPGWYLSCKGELCSRFLQRLAKGRFYWFPCLHFLIL